MQTLFPSFSLAWRFLTVISLPGLAPSQFSGRELALSMRWYPVVGFAIGSMLVGFDEIFSTVLSPLVVNVLLIGALVTLTGGLHQDGLADTIDGLAGGRTWDQRLAIMRDGHIGAIGATGLILALALRYTGLATLPQGERGALLFCMPSVGRWSLVVASLSSFYPRKEGGLAAPFVNELNVMDTFWATLPLAVGLCWIFGLLEGGMVLITMALFTRALVMFANRAFGGVTGDVLGGINEVIEIAFLIGAPFMILAIF